MTTTRFPLWAAALLALALSLPGFSWAALPQTLNYQGRLTLTGSGGPVPDSTGNTVVFRLFDSLSGGTQVWTETWNGTVATKSGLFNVVLGSISPLNIAFDIPYWLEIQVNGDASPMTPRQPLTMAPFSFRAKDLELPLAQAKPLGAVAGIDVNNTSVSATAVGLKGTANSGYGVKGFGATGIYGSSTAGGGYGVVADQGTGDQALRVIGNASFNPGSVSFGAHVDFSGATVTGWNMPLALPLLLSASAPFPQAILSATNSGSGYAVAGFATLPGGFVGGAAPSYNSFISAGVKGYTNVTNSVGVAGFSDITTSNGLGVMGLGVAGVGGFGRSDVPGSKGGDFSSDALNGIGVSASAQTGTAGSFNGLTGVVISGNTMGLVVQGGALINGLRYPLTDGTAGQLLTTNGLGLLSFSSATAPVAPLSLTSAVSTVPALYAFNSGLGTAVLISSSAAGSGTLAVRNGSGASQSYGILSVTNGTGATRVGVVGASDPNFANPPGASGIYGYSLQGSGVSGYVDGNVNTGAAVRGENTRATGYGVLAYNSAASGAAIALSASTASSTGMAGYFQAATGLVALGSSMGVSAVASSAGAIGVYGEGGTATGIGVLGHSTFNSMSAAGVVGTGAQIGISGTATQGNGGTAIGVIGQAAPFSLTQGFGVVGQNNGTGISNGYGVSGSGPSGGVIGDATNVKGVGVFGTQGSGSGAGVYGQNQADGAGVAAEGVSVALSATASSGTAIVAYGNTTYTAAEITNFGGGSGLSVGSNGGSAPTGNFNNAGGTGPVLLLSHDNDGSLIVGQSTAGIGMLLSGVDSGIKLSYNGGFGGVGLSVTASGISTAGLGAYLQGISGAVLVASAMGLSVTSQGSSSSAIFAQVSSSAPAVMAVNNNTVGYGLQAENGAADASVGGAALFVKGPLKMQGGSYSDSSANGSPSGLAAITTSVGRIRFTAVGKTIPAAGVYGPIPCSNTVLNPQSVVLVSFMTNVATVFTVVAKVNTAGNAFSVNMASSAGVTFSTNDQLNFVIINQ
jgi:hypothetical protein